MWPIVLKNNRLNLADSLYYNILMINAQEIPYWADAAKKALLNC